MCYSLQDPYFITITVQNWIDLFTDEEYFNLLINSLKYYQEVKGLKLYGYVFMSNHIHLIAQSKDIIGFVREFKIYTTRILKNLIREDKRKFINMILQDRIWRSNNWPVIINSNQFFKQKLNYIHNNPVKKGLVIKPEDWKYSSARNYIKNDDFIIKISKLTNRSLEPTLKRKINKNLRF